MSFLDLRYNAFGLDISDSAVKLVKLEKKQGKISVASFNTVKLGDGVIDDGLIKDPKALASAIKLCRTSVKNKKIKTKYVVASLPEKESFLVVIKMPKMKEEELKTALTFEIESYLPMAVEKVYMDFHIISPIGAPIDHLDVLCVATPKNIVDSYVLAIKSAGLIPIALEIESQAIARALVKNETSEFPLLLINIDDKKVDFIFFAGRATRFTNSMTIENGKLDEAQFLSQTRKLIEYYQDHSSHEHLASTEVKKIIIAGQFPGFEELIAVMKKELGVAVEPAGPFINLPMNKKIKADNFMLLSSALGLAMRAVDINYD